MNKYIDDFFTFPETINEVAARLVATGVILMSVATLYLLSQNNSYVLIPLVLLVYGFLARVTSGPKISPLALVVTKFLVPKLNFQEKLVPGPPKRFAQGVGLIFSLSTVVTFLFGFVNFSIILISVLTLFACLEAFMGLCAGCKVFKILMYLKIIPEEVCERCSNLEF